MSLTDDRMRELEWAATFLRTHQRRRCRCGGECDACREWDRAAEKIGPEAMLEVLAAVRAGRPASRPSVRLLGADVATGIDWTAIALEIQVGPLVARVTERDIPENTMKDGTRQGMLENARILGTMPQLSGALVHGLEEALKVYGDFLDRLAAKRPR